MITRIVRSTVFLFFLLLFFVAGAAEIQAAAVLPTVEMVQDEVQTQSVFEYSQEVKDTPFKLTSFYQFPVLAEDFKGVSQRMHTGHPGYDIRAVYGAPIHPIRPGKVKVVGSERGGYGIYVVVEHDNGVQTLSAHMQKTEMLVGQSVRWDTVIGYVGLTGHTTGSHVHFEVFGDNQLIEPAKVLPLVEAKAVADK